MYMIRDIPNEERPRERLLKYGCTNLSNQELLAIVLKTGTSNKSVKELALDILNSINDIGDLKNITVSKLQTIKGIGTVKAIELVAAIELGKRIFVTSNSSLNIFNNALDIWRGTKELFYDKKQEYFYALYFNNKKELLAKKLLFLGTVNKSIVHPREIFKEAYLLSASSIVCIHNHPSGDTKPSKEDIYFTNNLVKIGRIQGIPVLDHIIVSNKSFYSFFANGLIR